MGEKAMAWVNERSWSEINDSVGTPEEDAQAWITRFTDPNMSLDELLGKLERVFDGPPPRADHLVPFLMDLASCPSIETKPGELYDRTKGRCLVQLRNTAFEVLMDSYIDRRMGPGRTLPEPFRNSEVMINLLRVIGEHLPRYKADSLKAGGTHYKTITKAVIEKYLDSETKHSNLTSRAAETVLPRILRLVNQEHLNVVLFPTRPNDDEQDHVRDLVLRNHVKSVLFSDRTEGNSLSELAESPLRTQLIAHVVQQRGRILARRRATGSKKTIEHCDHLLLNLPAL